MVFSPILQTVQDKENPDYVESNGPFLGKKDTWLSRGYYFWERFVDVAEWWGETHCNGKYMICSATAHFNDGELLDLVHSTEDMDNFRKICDAISTKYPTKHITVSFVIEYLLKYGLFPYKGIRAHSIDCGKGDMLYRRMFREKQATKSYLNLMPTIQFCIIDKSCIQNYHIIYPPEYVQVV